MIGGPMRVAAVLGVGVVAAVFTMRPPDLAGADPVAHAQLADAVERRLTVPAAMLVRLEGDAEATLDAGRTAASRILGGESDPGELFERAANRWRAGEADARRVSLALDALRSDACPPLATLPALDPESLERATAAFTDAAHRATTVFELRRASERTLDALSRTLAALEMSDHEAALAASAEGRAELDRAAAAYAEMQTSMPTGSIWLDTAERLVGAAAEMAAAGADGDAVRAQQAAAAYEAAAEDAPVADRALSVALADGAGAATGAALSRAAAATQEIGAASATVSRLANEGGCG